MILCIDSLKKDVIVTGFHRLMRIGVRIGRRLRYELQYYAKKGVYCAFSVLKVNRNKTFEKRVAKCFEDRPLRVFLNQSLSEIDLKLETDSDLKAHIVSEGELVMRHTWLVLNEHRENMFDPQSGHYRWTEDFFTGYRYPNCFYQDVRKSKTLPNTDIKIPWETARMQSLFALALSFRATKDEKYARRIIEIIRDFTECCPYDTGVNWNVSMEVGIRIANIILACELIWDAECCDIAFKRFLAAIVFGHMLHIRKNMENPRDGNNHLIADLLGLAATSAAMPFLPRAKSCTYYVQKMLHREIMRQILADGGHFEGSVSYHRLVGEMLCFAVMAQKKIGFELTEEEIERLSGMGLFTAGIRMSNGLVPQFGDTDSGRVFQLAPEHTRDHDSFLNLVFCLTKNKLVYPGRKDGFFIFYCTDTIVDSSLDQQVKVRMYPNTKLMCVNQDDVSFAFSAMTPDTFDKAGHSHNDVLSFVLSRDGDEFITDPGSGEYTGNREIGFATRSVNMHSAVSVDHSEQRIPPDNRRPFVWTSKVRSTLQQNDSNADGICFFGNCSYHGKNGSIQQQRTITIFPSEIVIEDALQGITKECSMTLPVYPGITISELEKGIVLIGKAHRLLVCGTYRFSIVPVYYAEQYKKIVDSQAIRCSSNADQNELRLEWIN